MSIVTFLRSELPRALRRLSATGKSGFAVLCAERVAAADVTDAPASVRSRWRDAVAALELLWPMVGGSPVDRAAVDRIQGELLAAVSSPDGTTTTVETLWLMLLNDCLCATIYAARALVLSAQDNAVGSAQRAVDVRFTADQLTGRIPIVGVVRSPNDVPDASMLVERDLQLQDIEDLRALDGADSTAWADRLAALRGRARSACVRLR